MGNATSETTVPSIAIPLVPLAEAQPEGTLLPLTSWEYKQYDQLAIKIDYFVRFSSPTIQYITFTIF
jgi:hypothetical protein